MSLVAPFAALPSVEAKEVRVYSGRHYNTDRAAYKQFSEETGIKVRLIEATGIYEYPIRGTSSSKTLQDLGPFKPDGVPISELDELKNQQFESWRLLDGNK